MLNLYIDFWIIIMNNTYCFNTPGPLLSTFYMLTTSSIPATFEVGTLV